MFLVQDFVEQSAARAPTKTALVCGDLRLTWADVDRRANQLANELRSRGFRRGERAVLWAANGPELAVAIFAVLKADGVFVVLPDSSKPMQVAGIVADCGGVALLCAANRSKAALEVAQACRSLRILVTSGATANDPGRPDWIDLDAVHRDGDASRPPRVGIDRDLACLIYTSGSTGKPKGVMSGHHNVVFAARSITSYLRNTADDVVISALPLSFDYGLYQWLMVGLFGGTLVLERSFAYPAEFLHRLAAERATGLPGVPTMFAMLLNLDLAAFDLGSLRYLTNTGAALPPRHIERLREIVPQALVFSMYGLTETKRTLYLPPEDLDRKPGSVGVAIPGTEVWLEDALGNRLGPDQVGELVVRGGHVMRGYWGNAEATAARFRPGWLPGETVCHSGDLFRRDADGYHYFVARTDDVLKSRGEKVAPAEIEQVISELDGVVEVRVIGVDDPVLGQAIVAQVVRRDDTLLDKQILLHCKSRLEDFKLPRRVEFVTDLPKNANGKITR
ncbi:MAG: AMP-binding protein [Planctomycetes bacterium]|nr:AMP-binding protein [Planctomycetota bacterium]